MIQAIRLVQSMFPVWFCNIACEKKKDGSNQFEHCAQNSIFIIRGPSKQLKTWKQFALESLCCRRRRSQSNYFSQWNCARILLQAAECEFWDLLQISLWNGSTKSQCNADTIATCPRISNTNQKKTAHASVLQQRLEKHPQTRSKNNTSVALRKLTEITKATVTKNACTKIWAWSWILECGNLGNELSVLIGSNCSGWATHIQQF